MFLAELFKNAVEYTKVTPRVGGNSVREYHFGLDDLTYEVYLERQSTIPDWQRKGLAMAYENEVADDIARGPVLYVEFSVLTPPGSGTESRYGLTGRGQAATVLSTVLDIIKQESDGIRYLKFDAKENNRQGLYRKIAQRFGKKTYWTHRANAGNNVLGDKVFFVKL